MRSVEALSEALSNWGGENTGSIVVISHDKAFCERVGFTHVITVDGKGGLKLEQRDARESDWDPSAGLMATAAGRHTPLHENNNFEDNSPPLLELDAKQRKQAYNAPKRIAKIENMVESLEEKMSAVDQEMLANGNDVGKLSDLTKQKQMLESEMTKLMEEWEELEGLLAAMAVAI